LANVGLLKDKFYFIGLSSRWIFVSLFPVFLSFTFSKRNKNIETLFLIGNVHNWRHSIDMGFKNFVIVKFHRYKAFKCVRVVKNCMTSFMEDPVRILDPLYGAKARKISTDSSLVLTNSVVQWTSVRYNRELVITVNIYVWKW
jgi:hypothetical protein